MLHKHLSFGARGVYFEVMSSTSEGEASAQSLIGKKVFFLHPHSVIKDELLARVIAAEYEVYTLKDRERALNILRRFPESILFINIDAGMKEPEWEKYVRRIQDDAELCSTRIGILSYNNDKELMQKYLFDIGIPCGFIQLKLGLEQSTKIILTALRANEARGRRKFVRVNCEQDGKATLNYKSDRGVANATIIDISSAGLACKFLSDPGLTPKTHLRNIQLKLRGKLLPVDAILMGTRSDESHVWVMLFDPKTEPNHKATIRDFIHTELQRHLESIDI